MTGQRFDNETVLSNTYAYESEVQKDDKENQQRGKVLLQFCNKVTL